MSTQSVRHQLSFTSINSDSLIPETPEADSETNSQAPHYQTRAQQKTIDGMEQKLCVASKSYHNQYSVAKELHNNRMVKLREILEAEKKMDWMFDKK